MIPLYEILHFGTDTPKRLCISLGEHYGTVKEGDIIISLLSKDSARDLVHVERLVSLNSKYNTTKEVKE